MGQKYSHLRPEQLSDLLGCTEFNEEEINSWYKDFQRDFPSGHLRLKDFFKIYRYIFPYGDPTAFAEQVFLAFDADGNGVIDFREFLCALSVTSRGSEEQKLAWSFRMYDTDKDGYITKHELLSTIKTIHKLAGPLCGEHMLDNVKNDPTKLADAIFKKLDKNDDGKLSVDEFIRGAREDPTVSRILRRDMFNCKHNS